jgi:hypothetical protein
MLNKKVTPFELKCAHIALIKRLNLKINQDYTYDNWLVPVVDAKRPFGNSDMLGDIFSIIGVNPDADGNYAEADQLSAYLLLAELPAAMDAIMNYETFTPGVYEIDNCGGAFSMQLAKNYITLSPALNALRENQELSKYFERTDLLCRSICGDKPWAKVREMLEGSVMWLEPEDPRRKEVKQILDIFDEFRKKSILTTE